MIPLGPVRGLVQGTGADLDIRLGFQAMFVRGYKVSDGIEVFWEKAMALENGMSRAAAGDRAAASSTGVYLIVISPNVVGGETVTVATTGDVALGNANGIRFESDAVCNINGSLMAWEAWPDDMNYIRAVHDGTTSAAYLEDSNIDFQKAGVKAGDIIINSTNDDRTAVVAVQRPSGKTKFCRLTVAAGLTPDFDTSDVCIIIKPEYEQITAITAMT